MTFTNQTFVDEEISLDDNGYENYTFILCLFIYEGGAASLKDNSLKQPRFVFRDAAANTIQFMAKLYSGGGRNIIEATITNIRDSDVGEDDILDAELLD